jgi:hypothetical protein
MKASHKLMFSRDDGLIALLLFMGLYFPSSSGGEDSNLFFWANRFLSLILFLWLAWKHGTRPGAVTFVSLPIVIFMAVCTLSNWPFRLQWGIFAAFSLVAMLLALDLRRVRPGRFAYACFVLANVLNIACGIAILAGNEWIGHLLSNFYSEFYPELVPAMLSLHKPVLTFANHSVAGFFIYLFFWLNWETYQRDRNKLALGFALSELVLLLALASFTSLTFSVLAVIQIGVWLWNRSRKTFAATILCTLLLVLIGGRLLQDQIGSLEELQIGVERLNNAISGPVARYGPDGNVLNTTVGYLVRHPLSPIGFAPPISADVIDSGTVEYLVRGSVPLLVLVYLGLYQFLRHNLPSRVHVLTLFLAIVMFETGFTTLIYYRTACLLSFIVIWLNQIASKPRPSVAQTSIG